MKQRTWMRNSWLTVLAALCACDSIPVQLGPELEAKYETAPPREISVETCGFQLLLLIPIRTNSRQLRAYRALKLQAGEDYLADIKITERWVYAVVGTVYCTAMEATAYPRIKS